MIDVTASPAGGLIGFMKKGSGASLMAGFIVAGTLLFCSALMADPTNGLGVRLALGESSLLTIPSNRHVSRAICTLSLLLSA